MQLWTIFGRPGHAVTAAASLLPCIRLIARSVRPSSGTLRAGGSANKESRLASEERMRSAMHVRLICFEPGSRLKKLAIFSDIALRTPSLSTPRLIFPCCVKSPPSILEDFYEVGGGHRTHDCAKANGRRRYRDGSYLLRAFSRGVGDLEIRDVPISAVALFVNAGLSPYGRHKRYCLLRQLFQYWTARGELLASPMPSAPPKVRDTFVPYVYTRVELRKLLDATSLSQQMSWCSMSAGTFRTLLLFLYGTGMRLGEALRLEYPDLDLANAVIRIEETKFYKSRLVPIGQDVHQLLVQHLADRPARPACQKRVSEQTVRADCTADCGE